MRRVALYILIISGLPFGMTAHAFDFNSIKNAVKNMDVNKVVDVGKRIAASTKEMSVEQEIAVGNDLTSRLLGAMQPVNDPALQAYVNRVGRWLTLQTERPDLPWRFAVVDTDSLGAFATPGGNVVITAGLMRLMRDENELAGVLAHEIAHIVDKHHVKAIMKKARASLAKEMAANLANEYVANNPQITNAVMNAGMNVYSSGLDQGDELSADASGLRIAARSGYDPLGLVLVLMTLESIDIAEPRGALMFSTHPPTRQRLEALAELADELSAEQSGSLRDNTRFADAQSRLFAQP